jgi:hypothetical protein
VLSCNTRVLTDICVAWRLVRTRMCVCAHACVFVRVYTITSMCRTAGGTSCLLSRSLVLSLSRARSLSFTCLYTWGAVVALPEFEPIVVPRNFSLHTAVVTTILILVTIFAPHFTSEICCRCCAVGVLCRQRCCHTLRETGYQLNLYATN